MRRLLCSALFPVLLSTAACACGPAASQVTPMSSTASTPPAAPAPPTEEQRTAALDAASRAFVGELSAGDFAAASRRFGPKMSAALTPAKLGEIWAALAAQAGAFGAVEGSRIEKGPAVWVALVSCRFAHAPLTLEVAFDHEDRIEGFHARPGSASAEWAPPTTPTRPPSPSGR
jgi:hypothetical protein